MNHLKSEWNVKKDKSWKQTHRYREQTNGYHKGWDRVGVGGKNG